jgi:hypothetical protein
MLQKVIMQNGAELEPFEFAIDESMKQLSCCWYLVLLHIIPKNKWIFSNLLGTIFYKNIVIMFEMKHYAFVSIS